MSSGIIARLDPFGVWSLGFAMWYRGNGHTPGAAPQALLDHDIGALL
jgi:hypothetical protein